MAYSTISKPSLHFNTKLWTGTGSNGNAISGVGFAPDLAWVKNRSETFDHVWFDRVRGDNKHIESNNTSAEENEAYTLAFGSDGYSVGTNTLNKSGNNIVGWNWKAGGSASSNSDGSVTASLSANATAGFSISTFTTSASGTFTVGHGLGVAPKMIIYRPTGSSGWQIGHNSIGWTNFLTFTDAASASNTAFGNTAPTTSVWTGNTANVGANAPCVAYCFAEKKGYSKFGSYTGNNNADGPFVFTGFKPAWLMVKKYSNTNHWIIWDNKRSTKNGFNIIDKKLYANLNNAENGADDVSFLSNGFKFHTNTGDWNESENYIYMAFAAEPLVANVGQSIPATAR